MRAQNGRNTATVGVHPAVWGALGAFLGGLVVWAVLTLGGRDTSVTDPRPRLDPRSAPASAYEWRAHPPPAFPLPPYARFLERVRIVLDPGHGGRADRKGWKCGPTGLREAVVNLRVALFLREFLNAVGADVTLTRDSDVYLDPNDRADLQKRVEIANRLRADLFLSIHHNAADNSSQANYTSLFYHATPDDSPASLDAARYLLTGLNDALHLEQHLGCALVSDYEIFPEKGFRVLREAEVPAVLSEASFHSNPQEEERLRDEVYNRREAYGLFLGLARWAQAGLPRVTLIEPADGRVAPGQPIIVALDDDLRTRGGLGTGVPPLRAGSLVVQMDEEPVPYQADLEQGRLEIRPPAAVALRGGRLYVSFANAFGQHVLHPWLRLRPSVGD